MMRRGPGAASLKFRHASAKARPGRQQGVWTPSCSWRWRMTCKFLNLKPLKSNCWALVCPLVSGSHAGMAAIILIGKPGLSCLQSFKGTFY